MRSKAVRAAWGITVVVSACTLLPATASGQPNPPETTGSPAAKPAPVQRPAPAPVAPAPHAPRPAGAAGRTIVVERFEFTGNTLFSAQELEAIVAPYTNREIALLDIYEAADRVADRYHEAGYSLASVTPPAQRLTREGVVRLEVIEGRVGKVAVEGNRSYSQERLSRYLGAVRPGSVYRLDDLDVGLRRMNALPGLSARATLRPGDAYGTSDLVVTASEDRVSAALIGDNYGRENIGVYRGTVTGAFNNPLGYGDQLQLLYLHAEGGLLDYGYVGYSGAIGAGGLRGELSYGEAQFTALTGLSGLTVDGRNKTARAGLDWAMTVSRHGGTSLSAAVTNQKSNADVAGLTVTNPINLTLLEIGVSHSEVFDNLAMYQAQLTAASNFKSTNRANCDLNPANGEDCDRQLLRLEYALQYVQPLIGRLDLFAQGNAVYSPDPLPPVNPFSLGGPGSVRAYPTSEVRGDEGLFGSLALRYGFAFGPVQMQLRGFGDSGLAKTIDPGAGQSSQDSLSSVGVGADVLWLAGAFRVSGKVDWSFPTDNHVSSDGKDDRVYASLLVGF